MAITREQAYGALFALGQGLAWGSPPTTWAFTMRRVKTPDQIEGMMPAFCQGAYEETSTQTRGQDKLRIWKAAWFWYFFDGNDDTIIDSLVNPALDALDALFPPDPQVQTLGGVVYKAWISGEIQKIGGNIDGQMLVVIPISMIVP